MSYFSERELGECPRDYRAHDELFRLYQQMDAEHLPEIPDAEPKPAVRKKSRSKK